MEFAIGPISFKVFLFDDKIAPRLVVTAFYADSPL